MPQIPKTIVIYSLPGCPWCTLARQKLRANKQAFRDVSFKSSVRMPNGKRPTSFPTIWVNGRNRGGFDAMDKWIPQAKRPAKKARANTARSSRKNKNTA